MKRKVIIAIVIMLLLAASIKPACMYYEYKQEKNRLSQKPYFTEYKITQYELRVMVHNYYVDENPSWRDDLNEDEWPDYSYYTMEATEDTDIAVTVLNYWLFEDFSDINQDGLEKAEEYGFSLENPITVEWAMEHPKEAVEIMYGMSGHGDFFSDYQWMKRVYDDEIMGIAEDTTEQSEQSTEYETEQQNSTEQENSTEQQSSTEQQNFIEQLEESTEQEII
jgi:hypothetical protein